MTYGYVRVSTDKQTVDNQKNEILNYAQINKLFIDSFIDVEISSKKNTEDRKIDYLISQLSKDDILIVSELSRLGRSTVEVLGIIENILKLGVTIIFIKQGLRVSNDTKDATSKVMITLFSLFAELERDLISNRTKEALKSRKDKGQILGRKLDSLSISQYDAKANEILTLLNKKVSYTTIIKLLGFGSAKTLIEWSKKRLEYSQFMQESIFNDKYKKFILKQQEKN